MMNIEEFKSIKSLELYTITEQIAEYLKQLIIHGDLKQGTKLPSENEMAKKFQVSRQTIRDALKLLASCRLITSQPGRNGGHYVAKLTKKAIEYNFGDFMRLTVTLQGFSLDEVIEMRKLIEIKASYFAALRRTEKQLIEMEKCISFLINEPLTDLTFYKSDFLFHKRIADATNNRLLIMSIDSLSYTLAPLFKHQECHPSIKNILIEELQSIYQAIKEGDPDKSAEKMQQHITHFEQFFENNRD